MYLKEGQGSGIRSTRFCAVERIHREKIGVWEAERSERMERSWAQIHAEEGGCEVIWTAKNTKR
jgi:hypothetical protein